MLERLPVVPGEALKDDPRPSPCDWDLRRFFKGGAVVFADELNEGA